MAIIEKPLRRGSFRHRLNLDHALNLYFDLNAGLKKEATGVRPPR